MSSAIQPEKVTAVPLADLSIIDSALEQGDDALREAVKRVRPADLGHDLSRRRAEENSRIFSVMEDRRAAAMLRAAHSAVAGQLLPGAPAERAAKILGFMPTDHQVQILAMVEPGARSRIEAAMEPGELETVKRLLAYDEVAVGRLMTPKIWRAEVHQTAGDALAILRRECDDIEVAVNLYVLDGPRLVGVVPLREATLAAPDTALAEIMTRDPITVREDVPRGDAADIIRTHDFLSLPVVDPGGHLVGAVRVDDVLDAVLDRVGDGFLNQGGVAGKVAARAPYFLTPLTRTVRSRLTWLILLFVAETLTGTVLRVFEDSLAKVVALSFFVPLLIGTGGNAGSQTVATVIRASALGEVRPGDVGRVVLREVSVGILLGLLVGAIALGRAMLWGVGFDLALCVGLTVVIVVTWANLVGAGIPLLAQRVGIDPTVVSGPLITTLVDATGLFIYFTVAHLTLAQLADRPDTAVPYDCAVVEFHAPDRLAGTDELPACDPDKPDVACWRVEPPGAHQRGARRFRLGVDHGRAAGEAGRPIEVRCAAHAAAP